MRIGIGEEKHENENLTESGFPGQVLDRKRADGVRGAPRIVFREILRRRQGTLSLFLDVCLRHFLYSEFKYGKNARVGYI